MNYTYKIRAHHGLCLYYFKGKGYSEEFVENMTDIKKNLAKNPPVLITDRADAVCTACPNHKDGLCATEDKVTEYDRQVLSRCNISPGDIMPFSEFEQLVQQNILISGKRKEVCGKCQWDALCRDI